MTDNIDKIDKLAERIRHIENLMTINRFGRYVDKEYTVTPTDLDTLRSLSKQFKELQTSIDQLKKQVAPFTFGDGDHYRIGFTYEI